MPRRSHAQRRALINARAVLAAQREASRPVLIRLLNPYRWRTIHDPIIRYLNETEFRNLLQVNKILRARLLDQPPPRKEVCEALKSWPLGSQNQMLHGQRASCWITSCNFPPSSLRPCEGPQLGIWYGNDMHNSTCEICADCSNDALFMFHPEMHLKISPLCRTCSHADVAAQRFPGTWTCRCLSPISSRNVRARLCYRCRRTLCDRLERRGIRNMAAKLPVRRPWIPVAARDERRWRTKTEEMLGGWLVGCRSCRISGTRLVQSYYDNPLNFFGPTHHPNDPNYENWRDPVWQFQAMRCMVFKCLECDGNIGWYSVALGTTGHP
jgi:hypothetical protein